MTMAYEWGKGMDFFVTVTDESGQKLLLRHGCIESIFDKVIDGIKCTSVTMRSGKSHSIPMSADEFLREIGRQKVTAMKDFMQGMTSANPFWTGVGAGDSVVPV